MLNSTDYESDSNTVVEWPNRRILACRIDVVKRDFIIFLIDEASIYLTSNEDVLKKVLAQLNTAFNSNNYDGTIGNSLIDMTSVCNKFLDEYIFIKHNDTTYLIYDKE